MPKRDIAIYWTIIVLGGFLRFWALGKVPGGLSGDEAEEGVEAISMLSTSMDMWGDHLPVFFRHVGIGMNPLYTYLTLPIFKFFGVSVFNLRITSAVLGFLTIPVTYLAAREAYGRRVGLLAMLLVAILPWHVMNSRWGIEYSILPFWFTLGLYTIGKALNTEQGGWKVVSLVPWSIGFYSYISTIIPVAGILAVTAFVFRKNLIRFWPWWVVGGVLALGISFPLLCFLMVNTLKITLPFASHLPFSIPALPVSRYAQVTEPLKPMLLENLRFLIGGFQDDVVLNQSGDLLPLSGPAPLFILAGAIYGVFIAMREKKADFILCVVALIVVQPLMYRLNVNRINWFYIPAIIIAARFLIDLTSHLESSCVKTSWVAAKWVFLSLFSIAFYVNYFVLYNTESASQDMSLRNGFRLELEPALRSAIDEARPGDLIYIGAGGAHPYLYVLFYGLADIRSFQLSRQLRPDADGMYHVTRFDRFVFERAALPADQAFVFVSRSDDLPCATAKVSTSGPIWAVGRCQP